MDPSPDEIRKPSLFDIHDDLDASLISLLENEYLELKDHVWLSFLALLMSDHYADVWLKNQGMTAEQFDECARRGFLRFLTQSQRTLIECKFFEPHVSISERLSDSLFRHVFIPWCRSDLRAALADSKHTNPRLYAIQNVVYALRRLKLDQWQSTERLDIGIQRAAQRKGSLTKDIEQLSANDVLGMFFEHMPDHPELMLVNDDGVRRVNFDKLFDLIRTRARRPELADEETMEAATAPVLGSMGVDAMLAREVCNVLEDYRTRSPANAAAVDHLEGGITLDAVAAKHGISIDQVRYAKATIESDIRKRFA